MGAKQWRLIILRCWLYQHAGYVLFLTGIAYGIGAYYGEVYCIYQWGLDKAFLGVVFTVLLGLSGLAAGICIQRLYWTTDTDPLTNLGNRRYFYRRLANELALIRKTRQPLVLAFIDVDDFKRVNDTRGHIAGDQVLMRISAIFKQNTGSVDSSVRWGGDEFILILPGATGEAAKNVIKRISRQISADPLLHGVTISAGLVTVTGEMNIEQILMQADQFLHNAKQVKNSIVHY